MGVQCRVDGVRVGGTVGVMDGSPLRGSQAGAGLNLTETASPGSSKSVLEPQASAMQLPFVPLNTDIVRYRTVRPPL